MNIAITGHSGLIGKQLMKLLQSTRHAPHIKTFQRKKHSLLDIQSLQTLVKDCDVVFHLAAINDPNHPDIFKVNILGTLNLLTAIENSAKKTCKVVFSSTFAVYKPPSSQKVITEHSSTVPQNAYGLSKLLCEQALEVFSARRKMSIVILRIANAYGPDAGPTSHSVIPQFIASIKAKKTITIHGDGTQTRDFIFTQDIAKALWLSGTKELSQRSITCNICSGTQISINTLIDKIATLARQKIHVRYIETNRMQKSFWQGDNTRAQKIFSWKPSITLQRGITLTWQSM